MFRILTGIIACSAVLVSVAGGSAAETNRYNVLFIAVDDLRTELGCYGIDYAPSPNIDRLAQSGMVFNQHFVQVPTCGASRYALLTGRSPIASGVTRNNQAMYSGRTALVHELLDGAQTFPEILRRSGYHTVCIGKISHTPDGRVFAYDGSGDGRREVPHAWDELATPFGPWKRGWGIFFAYAGGRHREDGQGHRDLMEFVAEEDDDLPDGMMADEAIETLQRLSQEDEPFLLGLGFFKPHLPFVATRADWEAVAELDVPPPPHPEKPDSAYWHRSGEFYQYDFPFPKTRPLAEEDVLRCRRAYLACVRYVDRQIGRVLSALEETGLDRNTVVVLWGDHGWNLGDSQLWGKHTVLERAVRSPLIIRVPQMAGAGKVSHALVETTDIYPTLVELCQPSFTETAHPLDGTSLVPLLEEPEKDFRPAARSFWQRGVAIRTHNRRLIATRTEDGWQNVELYGGEGTEPAAFDPVENLAPREPETVKRLLEFLPEQ